MVASILVAAPATAADDPKADYKATFDACETAPSSGFTDVPEGHANAVDIDCIAYYGITKGTSATTYSPLMSVSREHMALFLTRLAKRVGIETDMMGDDMESGFTDIGELSEESQTAIGQLKDLGITKGTSDTTYSPADPVTRGQMALFVQRLMNNMDQMADGDPSLSSTEVYGYLPSDVVANKRVKVLEGGVLQMVAPKIASPFTDINSVSNEQHDAITQLWELGVASGISDTSYAPDVNITRATMAGFMTAVLDHSNVRPAGLSIQVTPEEGWGSIATTVLVSYRDDSFAPVEDKSIDMFSSAAPNNGLRDDGTCNKGDDPDDVAGGDLVTGDCTWDKNDDATDSDGNIFFDGEVAPGKTRVYSAWIGEDDGDEFDADKFDAVTDDATAKPVQAGLRVTSTVLPEAACTSTTNGVHTFQTPPAKTSPDPKDSEPACPSSHPAEAVDLGSVSSVTYTVQLIDEDGNDVERSDIEIDVGYEKPGYTNTLYADLTTDAKGQITFDVPAPVNTRSNKDDRRDKVTFTGYHPGQQRKEIEEEIWEIQWTEVPARLVTTRLVPDDYVIERRGEARVSVIVRLYDQYGNSHRSHSSQKVVIGIGSNTDANSAQPAITEVPVNNVPTDAGLAASLEATSDSAKNMALRQVVSRGFTRWARTAPGDSNDVINVIYNVRQLARNSDGVAVQATAAAADGDYEDHELTYNDGRVPVLVGVGDDRTSRAAVYHFDDDNDPDTPFTNDDTTATQDDTPTVVVADDNDPATNSDVEILISRAVKYAGYDDPATTDVTETAGAFEVIVRGILSEAAFDLHTGEAGKAVPVVAKADSQDLDDEITVTKLLADANEFLADNTTATDDDDPNPELVYSYDSDDLFIDSSPNGHGAEIDIDKCEAHLGRFIADVNTHAVVEVLHYSIDGQSIFRVISKAS